MSSTATGTISKVFDTTSTQRYRIRMQIKPQLNDAYEIVVGIGQNATYRTLITSPAYGNTVWVGIDEIVTVLPTDNRNMRIQVTSTSTLGAEQSTYFYMKNLLVEKLVKSEVQDSDLFGGGRRFSYYEGSKMTSQDFNVDSPDTADGGPVIVVNTVSPNTPSSNPIGTSTGAAQEGRAIVNRSPSSNAS